MSVLQEQFIKTLNKMMYSLGFLLIPSKQYLLTLLI